ncbi:MAG TPA: hypothetical protein PKA41_07720 [Verrucomicrobiota bacterium]|nr:hypothetical protein [Verrucomicrobiota bacterium]
MPKRTDTFGVPSMRDSISGLEPHDPDIAGEKLMGANCRTVVQFQCRRPSLSIVRDHEQS